MSVLIKGMEMPINCVSCKVAVTVKDGVLCTPMFRIVKEILSGRQQDCPLIEVPKHGRLIDADEMFTEFVIEGQRSKRYKIGEKWELNGEEIRSVISRLPTIIPAEEGE